jgi:hypothetical protein
VGQEAPPSPDRLPRGASRLGLCFHGCSGEPREGALAQFKRCGYAYVEIDILDADDPERPTSTTTSKMKSMMIDIDGQEGRL